MRIDHADPRGERTEKPLQVYPVREKLEIPEHFPSMTVEVPAPAVNHRAHVDADGKGGVRESAERIAGLAALVEEFGCNPVACGGERPADVLIPERAQFPLLALTLEIVRHDLAQRLGGRVELVDVVAPDRPRELVRLPAPSRVQVRSFLVREDVWAERAPELTLVRSISEKQVRVFQGRVVEIQDLKSPAAR